jgi:DNA-binding MarR family transcriptional regulator
MARPTRMLPDHAAHDDVAEVFNSLRRLVHALHNASRETERRLGVTGAQLFVLTQLRATPSLSINALAERTMTHQSTVSVVVRRLADDARRVELTLTAAGNALLRRAPEPVQVQLARAIEAFDAADRRTLAIALKRLVRALGADAAAAPMLFESP